MVVPTVAERKAVPERATGVVVAKDVVVKGRRVVLVLVTVVFVVVLAARVVVFVVMEASNDLVVVAPIGISDAKGHMVTDPQLETIEKEEGWEN